MKLKKFENFEEFFEETDNNIVLEIYVDTYEFDNISYIYDNAIQNRFGFNEMDYNFEYIYNGHTPSSYNPFIKIDDIINKLNEFKNKGAEFVSIDYHTDHGSYLLDSIKIEKK